MKQLIILSFFATCVDLPNLKKMLRPKFTYQFVRVNYDVYMSTGIKHWDWRYVGRCWSKP